MTTKKTSRRALLTSVMALVMCLVMLVGTTFAWFTDSVTSGVNTIKSGNLDVEVEYAKQPETDGELVWDAVTKTTKLFDNDTLWEPGHTEVVYLRVKNAGSLALKYSMNVANNAAFVGGTNVAGEKYSLADVLKVGAVKTENAYANREAAQAAVDGVATAITDTTVITENMEMLEAGAVSDIYALVLYMPTTVGNEANPITPNKASYIARFGLNVFATQAAKESDSFDNTYDENAAGYLKSMSFSFGEHEVTTSLQANGGYGAVQVERTAKVTIDADVYAVYSPNGNVWAAQAVKAGGSSKVIINGGTFTQVGVPADDPCDLIYALESATIEINGGTFKATQPERTLNCLDGSNAQIIVKGGSFYKYDPSNPTLGAGEVIVPDGYKVVQDGDWYTVTAA